MYYKDKKIQKGDLKMKDSLEIIKILLVMLYRGLIDTNNDYRNLM